MALVFARLILRYLSGALVTYGFMAQETGTMLGTDPDAAVALGFLLGATVELVYAEAKRRGWKT